jgi:hypothetical protein
LPRDIFEFWSGLPGDARVHPADAKVFDRVKHEFKLDCLVGVFRRPLKTAPVVLLFLSPGFDEGDSQHARSPVGQAYYAKMRIGEHNFPNKEEHESASAWSEKIVRQFGLNYKDVLSKLAFLNMGAYKSKDFNDWPMLAALPSSRVALDWAQPVLFPQAEAGQRVVVCLRSPRYRGLKEGERYGKSLFTPICTRGGIMHRGTMRDEVTVAVQKAVN